MVLKHPEYAHGISDAELIKEAIEFCDEELDSFMDMEFDSDSEVCCQRSNTFIRELVHRLSASPSPVYSRDGLIERLVKALDAAETYVIDGVTIAKENLEMNAAYPARKTRYEAELQEARDIYAECQAARRLALAAKEQQP